MNVLREAVARMVRAVLGLTEHLSSSTRKCITRLAYPGVSFGKGCTLYPGAKIRTFDGGHVIIGAGVSVLPCSIIDAKGATVRIGDGCIVGLASYIVGCAGIEIGANTLIAEHATIRDQDHNFDDPAVPVEAQGRTSAPVSIGENCWIGAKVTITRGVSIPAGSVIGANSVVTRSLSGGQVYAGAPAKMLR